MQAPNTSSISDKVVRWLQRLIWPLDYEEVQEPELKEVTPVWTPIVEKPMAVPIVESGPQPAPVEHGKKNNTNRLFADITGPEIQILGMDVWTEGETPCKKHCYHDQPVSPKHIKDLGLKRGEYHADLVCCNCTHGACSSAIGIYLKHVLSLRDKTQTATGG